MPGLIDWFVTRPVAAGVATLVLMWVDWRLSVLQHREREKYSANHYKSYPVDSVEGNPALQQAVSRGWLFEPRHLVPAIGVSAAVALVCWWIVVDLRPIFLGYMWGLFLIVSSTHLGNLIGYVASRRGIHGRVTIHQRTAYLVQAGRYAALAALLVIVAVLSGNTFAIGVALAGVSSSARQLGWLRRVPPIPEDDVAPEGV